MKYLLPLQGPWTQIDAFLMNIFPWLKDILIKRKNIFGVLTYGDLLWNIQFLYTHIRFSWSQFLHIWKIQQFFCLNFDGSKKENKWVAEEASSLFQDSEKNNPSTEKTYMYLVWKP